MWKSNTLDNGRQPGALVLLAHFGVRPAKGEDLKVKK
jgi:hypothetical protein